MELKRYNLQLKKRKKKPLLCDLGFEKEKLGTKEEKQGAENSGNN